MVLDFSSGIQYVCQIDVDSQTKTIRWIKNGKGVFGQADYVLRDDQLTLHERPNMVKVLRRGHVKLAETASPTSGDATKQEGNRDSEKQDQENPSPNTSTIPGDQ